MLCPQCRKGKPKVRKGAYHYLGSGLPDVYLTNVKWSVCPECKEVIVEIPRIGQLHRCLAWLIILKKSFLTGQEMIFLRKMLRKNQRQMAESLGVSQVSLNRWERETRPGHTKAIDSYFRMVYLQLHDDEYTHQLRQEIKEALVKHFANIKKSAPVALSARIDPQLCSPAKIIDEMLPITPAASAHPQPAARA